MVRTFIFWLLCITAGVGFAQENQILSPFNKAHLEQAVRQYEALTEAGSWQQLPDNLLLRPGDSSRYVLPLQENLLLTGDLYLDTIQHATRYTTAIAAAVKSFQGRHGLVADGVLGPQTIAALNVPPSDRLWQLRQNLSRWDQSFGNVMQPHVVINIPDYTLHVIEAERQVMEMRVIVGKPSLETMPIKSKLTTVVLHPYWYLPKSIAVEEIVPILRRNPGYLDKKNMKLEKPFGTGWVRVNPWRVNWDQVNSTNYNYRIVQLEGSGNELGQVKFPFPNSIPQYLHDTPKKELFTYPYRAFSHGCIRLEKPVDFAYYLLEKGSGYTTEKIDRLWERSKPNHYLSVHQPIPLYIVYLTAWVDDQLQVQFRDDVYGYDVRPHLTQEKLIPSN